MAVPMIKSRNENEVKDAIESYEVGGGLAWRLV